MEAEAGLDRYSGRKRWKEGKNGKKKSGKAGEREKQRQRQTDKKRETQTERHRETDKDTERELMRGQRMKQERKKEKRRVGHALRTHLCNKLLGISAE